MKNWLFVIVFALLTIGCDGDNNSSSSGLKDSDRDGLSDKIEESIGSNPYNHDTDYDGLSDYLEVGSPQSEDFMTFPLPDADGDGEPSIIDLDNQSADFDKDGISDIDEMYGYTVDPISGAISPWWTYKYEADGITPMLDAYNHAIKVDGDYTVAYFKSSSQDKNTDGDPYPDYQEAHGTNMQSVLHPANHPMIGAYPKLRTELSSFTVLPNATITSSNSTANSDGWTNETENTDKTELSASTEVKVDAQAAFPSSYGAGGEISVRAGASVKHTTSSRAKTTATGLTQNEWELARTETPAQAATLQLSLTLTNIGTAAVQGVDPILNLYIGNQPDLRQPIHTFRAQFAGGNAGTLSAGTEDNWITAQVTKNSTGDDLWVTMDQLRSLQLGAPLSVRITNDNNVGGTVLGAVTPTDGDNGNRPWAEFIPNIKTNSTHLLVDLGNGDLTDYLVYAGVPTVTVRDALLWILGQYVYNHRTGKMDLDSLETFSSTINLENPFDGWEIVFDSNAYNDLNELFNRMDSADPFSINLRPGASIAVRPPPGAHGPSFIWGYMGVQDNGGGYPVYAYVTDESVVTSVTFHDKNGHSYAMTSPLGDSIYHLSDDNLHDVTMLPPDYIPDGTEFIRACNDRNAPDGTPYCSEFHSLLGQVRSGTSTYRVHWSDVDTTTLTIDEGNEVAVLTNSNFPSDDTDYPDRKVTWKHLSSGVLAINQGVISEADFNAISLMSIFRNQPTEDPGATLLHDMNGWTVEKSSWSAHIKNLGNTWVLKFSDGSFGKIRYTSFEMGCTEGEGNNEVCYMPSDKVLTFEWKVWSAPL